MFNIVELGRIAFYNLINITDYRHGKEWKEERSAVNNQTLPRNVFAYTAGLNDVATQFTDYVRSARDENDRISDISLPLKQLLMESK